MSEKDLDEYARVYRDVVPRLIDELVAAARTGDEKRIEEIGGFGGALHAAIGELLVAAAARGRTMTEAEARMTFNTSEMH